MGYFQEYIVVVFISALHISLGESLKWIVATQPIKFGDSVSLRCIVPENTCPEDYVRRWTGGPSQTLLALNYKSSNKQKYKMHSIYNSTSFELIIYNFNENDLDCKYTCSCGFEQFGKTFSLQDNKYEFIYPVQNWTNNHTAVLANYHLNLHFAIEKVYPKTKCRLKLNDIVTVPNMTFAENYTVSQLSRIVSFTENITVNGSLCSALLIVECWNKTNETFLSVMQKKVKIAENCNDSFYSWKTLTMAVTLVCCTIIFAYFFYIIYQFFGKKRLLRTGLDKAKERHNLL